VNAKHPSRPHQIRDSAGDRSRWAGPAVTLDEVEAVARIGSFTTDLAAGCWVSSTGLDAILGIDAAFERTIDGWASLVHPADRDEIEAYLADEVIGQAHPFERRYRVRRADTGETRWVDGHGALELDRSGRPIRMVGTIADVTDQVAAEEERTRLEAGLRRSERNLAEAQRLAGIGSWEWDLASETALRSDELHRIYGVEPGEIRATTEAFLAFVHPDDRERVRAVERAAASGHGRYAMEYRTVRADGTIRILHDEAELVRDPSGSPVRMIGTVQDITERVAAERERMRLAAAVEQTSDAVLITDLAGTIEYVNPAFSRVSGYLREEVIGRNPRILKSGRQSAAFYRALWARLARGQDWTGRFFNRRADGSLYQVEATLSPIREPGGQITGYMGMQRDVTALQAARSGLATEFRERALIAAALARLQPGATAAETAAEVCGEFVGIPGVDVATIINFVDPEHAMTLAAAGPDGLPMAPGRPLPPARAAYLYERASQGPWAETFRPRRADAGYGRAMAAVGIRAMAYAPLRNGEGLLGLIAAGTRDQAYARHLVDHIPAVGEFAATASALLARDLEGDHRLSRRHARITQVMGERGFHPVFQPIVEIDGGQVVGYEALTRFSDGTRPDVRFGEAWSVDLGAELELVTLEAALAAARGLLPGRWLNVNVSPRLLDDTDRVRAVLDQADRPVIIEITEHETIDDYHALRDALARLGPAVRVAVDDAGAGIANFAHIIELRPDFVKLDIGLVHGVNADLGRQALVVGLRHFARTAGCRLIGEGVETDAEARTLATLGIEFGQGYFYGRPEALADVRAGQTGDSVV
jgi:PAS domain S-box-containing protein